MADIVNLRLARKAKARNAAKAQAQTNRALHSRSQAERTRDKQAADLLARKLDGARREQD